MSRKHVIIATLFITAHWIAGSYWIHFINKDQALSKLLGGLLHGAYSFSMLYLSMYYYLGGNKPKIILTETYISFPYPNFFPIRNKVIDFSSITDMREWWKQGSGMSSKTNRHGLRISTSFWRAYHLHYMDLSYKDISEIKNYINGQLSEPIKKKVNHKRSSEGSFTKLIFGSFGIILGILLIIYLMVWIFN